MVALCLDKFRQNAKVSPFFLQPTLSFFREERAAVIAARAPPDERREAMRRVLGVPWPVWCVLLTYPIAAMIFLYLHAIELAVGMGICGVFMLIANIMFKDQH